MLVCMSPVARAIESWMCGFFFDTTECLVYKPFVQASLQSDSLVCCFSVLLNVCKRRTAVRWFPVQHVLVQKNA